MVHSRELINDDETKGWEVTPNKKKKREKGQIKAATLRFERRTILEIGEKQGDIEHRSFEKLEGSAVRGEGDRKDRNTHSVKASKTAEDVSTHVTWRE
jgi:hypothetical protein